MRNDGPMRRDRVSQLSPSVSVQEAWPREDSRKVAICRPETGFTLDLLVP